MTAPAERAGTGSRAAAADVAAIDRPDPSLLAYYRILSLLSGPAFLVVFPLHFFKYRTLRYAFDDEGVTMRWGALFRRETRVHYDRLQDIHLSSNFLERRFGLARVQLQTASGSAKPEMTIEGIREYEALRDFLYRKMRGAAGEPRAQADGADDPATGALADGLHQIAEELARIRALLEASADRETAEGDG